MLIIQENSTGCADGLCDVPETEGNRPAGTLSFDFQDVSVLSFGFDLIDVESLAAEGGWIAFYDWANDLSAMLMFNDFLQGFDLGDNTANRVAPFIASELGLGSINEVVIKLGGSGAMDNVENQIVPEPTSLMLISLGLVALGTCAKGSARRNHDLAR
jgi:hypothetical protein